MPINFTSLIWLFFLSMSLLPIIRQRRLETDRISLLRSLERERQSRVITLIHRQESINFLGIPVRRFIDLEDSERILRAIRLTPDDMPIDVILHTPGGLVLAAEQIARALKRHPAKVTVIVPHYAMSGGTLICLAADEILLDQNAVLGPIDPQIGQYPASSILRVLQQKPISEVDDTTIILADVAEKAIRQVEETAFELISERMEEEKARKLASTLSEGYWTHDYALVCSTLAELGLPVGCNLPDKIHALMDLYPQPSRQQPAVDFIPLPYRRDGKPN